MNAHTWKKSRQDRFHEILATAKRVHRAFSTRACIVCGEAYVPSTHALQIDPRCGHCVREREPQREAVVAEE